MVKFVYTVSSSAVMVAFVVALASWGVPGGEAHPNYSSNKTQLCTTMEPGHGVSPQPDTEFSKYFKLTGKEGTHNDFLGNYNKRCKKNLIKLAQQLKFFQIFS